MDPGSGSAGEGSGRSAGAALEAADVLVCDWSVLALEPAPASVGQVRRGARAALEAWGLADEYEWVLSLVLTEVATNVVLHAGTPFDVRLAYRPGGVRCEVSDANPRVPRPRQHSLEATTGRGLQLVKEMTTAWGVQTHPGNGKTVWFEVAPPAADPTPDRAAEDVVDLDAFLGAADCRAGEPSPQAEPVPETAPALSSDAAAYGRAS